MCAFMFSVLDTCNSINSEVLYSLRIEKLKGKEKKGIEHMHERIPHEHTLLIGSNIYRGKGQLKATFNVPFP